METDKRWVARLARQVQVAEIELVTQLAQIELDFGRLMKLKVGDVLPVELPPTVTATVDAMPVMECRYGVFHGQYALKVDRMLNSSGEDGAAA